MFSGTVSGFLKDVVNQDNLFLITCGEKLNAVATAVMEKIYMVDWTALSGISGFPQGKIVFARDFHKSKEPFDVLFRIIDRIEEKPKRILVFVKRKKMAQLLCIKLSLMKISSAFVHG